MFIVATRLQGSNEINTPLAERRSPYQSLAILLIPFIIVEPSKLVALAIIGKGHWLTGTIVMVVAYGLSISVVERIFKIMKPALLTLGWFTKTWRWFVMIREKAIALIRYRTS